MTDHSGEGLSTTDGPSSADEPPSEVGDWVRFAWSEAGTELGDWLDEATTDAVEAYAGDGPVVRRSRLLGLLPGETKLFTFDGILFEVTMTPDDPPAATSHERAAAPAGPTPNEEPPGPAPR